MSKQKKAYKERRVNVTAGLQGMGGGAEIPGAAPVERKTTFDYTHVKKDLARIGILAGSIIAVFVVLSFFIK